MGRGRLGLYSYVSPGRESIRERIGIGRCTDVVRPFEFDRHVLVPFIVGFNALDDGQSGEVL